MPTRLRQCAELHTINLRRLSSKSPETRIVNVAVAAARTSCCGHRPAASWET